MTRSLILILVICHLNSLAQEIKKKRHKNEVFYVLTKDESIRHGAYSKRETFGIIEKGQYEMNKKVGIWEFYGLRGNLEQRYDYSENKVIVNDYSRTSISTKCVVVESGWPTDFSPAEEPVLIGGSSKFLRHVVKNMKYPLTARRRLTQGKVIVGVVVTKEGRLADPKVLQGLGDGCDEEALRVVYSFDSEWVPATYKGEKVDVMILLPLTFILG